MAKYLLLKHYRGAPAPVNDVPMDQWTPQEISAHVQYLHDFAARLEGTGEFVDSQALAPAGTFVRYDGEGRPPVTDGPFAETKDLIAGWMVIDVDSYERAVELAGNLSAVPGAGGEPINEWLEVRPFLAALRRDRLVDATNGLTRSLRLGLHDVGNETAFSHPAFPAAELGGRPGRTTATAGLRRTWAAGCSAPP